MNRSLIVLGLLAALLLLVACAPTSPAVPSSEGATGGPEDVSVLVYASPL